MYKLVFFLLMDAFLVRQMVIFLYRVESGEVQQLCNFSAGSQ